MWWWAIMDTTFRESPHNILTLQSVGRSYGRFTQPGSINWKQTKLAHYVPQQQILSRLWRKGWTTVLVFSVVLILNITCNNKTFTEWINISPDYVGGHMQQAEITEKQTTLEGCLKCACSSADKVNNDAIKAQLINANCPCLRTEKVMGSEKLPPSSGLGSQMLTIFFLSLPKKQVH